MGALDGFLSDTGRGGGGKAWLSKWKDDGKIIVWMHTKSSPLKAFVHPFIMLDEVKDEENPGRKKKILRFPKFVGCDPAEVYDKQNFRDRDDASKPQVIPDRDPFLILREYLRSQATAGKLSDGDVVFEWSDPRDGKVIRWTVGELSGRVKTGKQNYNHILHAKTEYVLVVVENDHPEKGPQIARENVMLGDLMRKEIKNQIESEGAEEGNPTITPYAFKWTFDGNAKITEMYGVARFNRAKLTPEIEKAIRETDPPEIDAYVKPHADDMVKIRAAFESAAQISLPLDQIFSEDRGVRRAVMTGQIVRTRTAPASEKTSTSTTSKSETTSEPTRTRKVAEIDPTPEPEATGRRRKKKDPEPEPEPEPEVTRIKCDDCDYMLLPTDEKCPKCGAEYEPVEEAKPAAKTKSEPSTSKPVTKAPAREPGDENDADVDDLPQEGEVYQVEDKCWQCGSFTRKVIDGRPHCANCGTDTDDDIPF